MRCQRGSQKVLYEVLSVGLERLAVMFMWAGSPQSSESGSSPAVILDPRPDKTPDTLKYRNSNSNNHGTEFIKDETTDRHRGNRGDRGSRTDQQWSQ